MLIVILYYILTKFSIEPIYFLFLDFTSIMCRYFNRKLLCFSLTVDILFFFHRKGVVIVLCWNLYFTWTIVFNCFRNHLNSYLLVSEGFTDSSESFWKHNDSSLLFNKCLNTWFLCDLLFNILFERKISLNTCSIVWYLLVSLNYYIICIFCIIVYTVHYSHMYIIFINQSCVTLFINTSTNTNF